MGLTQHLSTNREEWPNSYFEMLFYTKISKEEMVHLKVHIL